MTLDDLLQLVNRAFPAPKADSQQIVEPLPGLRLLRRGRPSEIEAMLYEPVLCLILQGRKEVSTRSETLSFGAGECLLVSHDLPVRSRVVEAPYVAMVFCVDLPTLQGLQGELPHPDGPARAAATQAADPALLDALGRTLALAPEDVATLGPLLRKELHYRLLRAPFGAMLRRLARPEGSASAISRAVHLIRMDLRETIEVPTLARRVGMSASAFYKHFKSITSTTPLQYQKELRLVEARRLLGSGASVSAAAYEVGYESPSQFSREYTRMFGLPPSRDARQRSLGGPTG